MTPNDSEALFSDSVRMEILLRSLLRPYKSSDGEWIAIPVTLTNGAWHLANFNITVWPVWIQSAITNMLLQQGGVRSEFPLTLEIDSAGKLVALQVKNKDSKSTASPVALVTEDGELA